MDCFTFLDYVNENCIGRQFNRKDIGQLLEKLRSKLYENKIKLLAEDLEKLEENGRTRFVLSADRHNSDFAIKLARQSNGIVYQLSNVPSKQPKCELVVVPSNDFNNRFTKTDLEPLIKGSKYKIYPLSDGTTVNLYFDKIATKWMFSSKNTFNLGELSWRGAKYNTTIMDVLAQYKDFSFDKLDKNCCYSIGFKHPAFHPFGQPQIFTLSQLGLLPQLGQTSQQEHLPQPEQKPIQWIKRAWIISGFNLEKKTQLTDDEIRQIGLPEQKLLPLKSLQSAKSIFMGMVAQCNRANDIYVKEGKVFLGYVLRSVNETETGEFSDILFESSLYKDIKYCVYNKPAIKNKLMRQKIKENFKNLNYVILDAYLNFYKRDVFIKLFPQFKTQYEKYDGVLNQTVNRIYNIIKSPTNETAEVKIFETKEEEHSFMLANEFISIVQKHYQVVRGDHFTSYQQKNAPNNRPNTMSKQLGTPIRNRETKQVAIDKKVIRNLIQNSRHIEIYVNILFS